MTDALALLQRQFLERCRSDLAALEALASEPLHPEVVHLVHRLAGTAGSFGYSEISAAAARYETAAGDAKREPFVDLLCRLRTLTQTF